MDSKHFEPVATASHETLPSYNSVVTEEAQPPIYLAPTTSTSSTTLLIPTAGPTLSSGFPYHPSLADFNMLPVGWEAFTKELQKAAAATPCQKMLAVLSGIATAAVIIDLWTSTCVAKYVWNKQVQKNAVKGLTQNGKENCCCKHKETVGAVMEKWNDKWAGMGVAVGLEVGEETHIAVEGEDMTEKNTLSEREYGRCRPKGCHTKKIACKGRGCCTSKRACGPKANSRRTCDRKRVSFRLVVRRKENERSEIELSEKMLG